MNTDAKTFLIDLLNTPSPTGFEMPGQRKWAGYVGQWADAVEVDTYGTAWATLDGTGSENTPRVMLEAHADEIGFMVQYITDEGFIHINRIGGSDQAIARAKRVHILGDQGVVPGVIGNTAIHLRERGKEEKVPDWPDLYIDIGATKKDEVAERGIRVGHPIVYADAVNEDLPGRLVGRALDNRIGGFIIAEALARVAKKRSVANVYAVNAVQEEIGGHGAEMIAYRLRPSVALVVDVTHATDTPGLSKPKHGDVKLGGGPSITHGTANHPQVVQRLMQVAEQENIPLQHEASSRFTGTDTDSIFKSRTGIASALISVPMRYMHSTVEMVHLDDVEHVIQLMAAFVQSVTDEDDFTARL